MTKTDFYPSLFDLFYQQSKSEETSIMLIWTYKERQKPPSDLYLLQVIMRVEVS